MSYTTPVYERFISSFDGTRLYASSVGEGPTVILCDGLGCAGFIWRYIVPVLVQQYRVIRWHYRGHGQSETPPLTSRFDVAAMQQDLTCIMDAYHIDRAAIVGHSMGVQVALEQALATPERVQALGLLCGSYGRPLDTLHGDGRFAAIFPMLQKVLARYPRGGRWAWRHFITSRVAYELALAFEVNRGMVTPSDFSRYFTDLAAVDTDVFLTTLAHLQHHSVEDRLIDIAAPSIIIAGEHDTMTPPWLSRRMQQLIPHAELIMVPSGTHVAPLEIPELVTVGLQRFLKGVMAPMRVPQLPLLLKTTPQRTEPIPS